MNRLAVLGLCILSMTLTARSQTLAVYTTNSQGENVRWLLTPTNETRAALMSLLVTEQKLRTIELSERRQFEEVSGLLRSGILKALAGDGVAMINTEPSRRLTAAIPGAMTAGATILAMRQLQSLIDKSLDRVDAIATSQLLALRSHVAASIADLDATFRNNMETAFDRLSVQQQKLLTDTQVMLYQTEKAMRELEEGAFEKASDLLCQSTVALSNFHLLFRRRGHPDLLCLSNPRIADAGPYHDQLLQFRGRNLRPNGAYPVVKLRVPAANQSIDLLSAGGETILQIALPGGINGKPGDMTPRGNLIVRADFSWKEAGVKAPDSRWIFMLRPYLVSSVSAVITPKIRQKSWRTRSQQFYVEADKNRTNTATWTIVKSADASEVVNCEWYETTKVGRSELMSPVAKTAGACQTTAIARGTGGGGGSYGIVMSLTEEIRQELSEPDYTSDAQIINSAGETLFKYPKELVPRDAIVIDSDFSWSVYAVKNTGTTFLLTNTQKSKPGQGIATMTAAPMVELTVRIEQ